MLTFVFQARSDRQPLEQIFPLVFTWACNPKEASVGLIKKYLVANYPDLDLGVEMKHYRLTMRWYCLFITLCWSRKALENAEKNGTLERLSGKGFSGTFQLVDGANKSGAKFEDAFENACIAMNEPKDVSVAKLRDYLSVYHAEYNTDNKPKVLKSALDRAVAKGWITQVCVDLLCFSFFYLGLSRYLGRASLALTASATPTIQVQGSSGARTLLNRKREPRLRRNRLPSNVARHFYHSKQPSYRPIWVIDILIHNRKKAVKRAAESESEDESSEEEEEEEAYKPKKGKRGPPSPRKTVEPAPKKKAKAAPAKKPAAKKAAAKPVVAKKSKSPGKGAMNKSRKGASRGKK